MLQIRNSDWLVTEYIRCRQAKFELRCTYTRSTLGVGSSNFERTTLARPIKKKSQNSEFISLWLSLLAAVEPIWPAQTNSLSCQVSVPVYFPASEPVFASRPASDHRPFGSWGAPHTTEEQRQPSLSLLHNYLSCNLGVAPSSSSIT